MASMSDEPRKETIWPVKQIAWDRILDLKLQHCKDTSDYVTKFREAVHFIVSVGLEINDQGLSYIFLHGLGGAYPIWLRVLYVQGGRVASPPKWQDLCDQLINISYCDKSSKGSELLGREQPESSDMKPVTKCDCCGNSYYSSDHRSVACSHKNHRSGKQGDLQTDQPSLPSNLRSPTDRCKASPARVQTESTTVRSPKQTLSQIVNLESPITASPRPGLVQPVPEMTFMTTPAQLSHVKPISRPFYSGLEASMWSNSIPAQDMRERHEVARQEEQAKEKAGKTKGRQAKLQTAIESGKPGERERADEAASTMIVARKI